MKYKEIITDAIKTSITMSEAAAKTNLAFSTFKRYATKYGLYSPNQGGKGLNKTKIKLDDVLSGKTYMVTSHLRKRLIREGYFEYKCSECGIFEWNGKKLSLELDHINGNKYDNSIENLRILCPNCHSQTPTYRKKNKIEPHN